MWHYRHTNEMYHNALESRPYYAVSYNDDDIYHYGVMGMKWGVRKQRETTGTGRGRGRKKLTAKQKKIIKNIAIGTGIATGIAGATALGAVAGKQLKQVGGLKGLKNLKSANMTKVLSNGKMRKMTLNERGLQTVVSKQPGFAERNRQAAVNALQRTAAAKEARATAERNAVFKKLDKSTRRSVFNVDNKVSKARNSVLNTLQDQRNYVKTHPKTTAVKIARTAIIGGALGGAGGAYGAYRVKKKREQK